MHTRTVSGNRLSEPCEVRKAWRAPWAKIDDGEGKDGHGLYLEAAWQVTVLAETLHGDDMVLLQPVQHWADQLLGVALLEIPWP